MGAARSDGRDRRTSIERGRHARRNGRALRLGRMGSTAPCLPRTGRGVGPTRARFDPVAGGAIAALRTRPRVRVAGRLLHPLPTGSTGLGDRTPTPGPRARRIRAGGGTTGPTTRQEPPPPGAGLGHRTTPTVAAGAPATAPGGVARAAEGRGATAGGRVTEGLGTEDRATAEDQGTGAVRAAAPEGRRARGPGSTTGRAGSPSPIAPCPER